MLITYRTVDNKNVCIVWGEVWSEPFSRKVGAKQVSTTSFYLRYDAKKVNGKLDAKTLCVTAWGRLSGQAALLQKRHEVVVFGMIQKDDYNSERKNKEMYKVTAQAIIPVTECWDFLVKTMSQNNAYPDAADFGEYSGDGIPAYDDYDSMV